MQIVRAPRPADHFTTFENALIRNSTITLRARGLLMLLLSYPPNWRTDYRTLARQEPEGEHAIRVSLKELREAGYIVQTKVRGERGRFVTTTMVYDVPQLPGQSCGDSPRAEERGAEEPVPEDRRSYEEPTTKDLEEVGHPQDDSGPRSRRDDLRSSAQKPRTKKLPRPARKPKVRAPLTDAALQASWQNFLTMDLGDIDTDPEIRNAAFRELLHHHGAIEPDKWAQAKIDDGQWDGFCASFDLGNNLEAVWG